MTMVQRAILGIAAFLVSVLGVRAVGADAHSARTTPVIVLPDDRHTRGDWIGAYGTHAYVLCGMRSRHSLYGGKGWPIGFSAFTGDPRERVRGWRSTAPAAGDRSVLWEPSGLRRTPAAFDDHGEVRPLGRGPDLHLRVSVPTGPFLLSLYFFEIDWIQYRAYRIRVYEQMNRRTPLAETTADNFFRGKYKRFAVIGPAKLRIVIERGQSANAQTSGLFLDRLTFPDMHLFDMASGTAAQRSETTQTLDHRAAEEAMEQRVSRLLARPQNEAMQQQYLHQERAFFDVVRGLHDSQPRSYYREFSGIWSRAQERLSRASRSLQKGSLPLHVHVLRYYAARARCDYEGARQALRDLSRPLLRQGVSSKTPYPDSIRRLEGFATSIMARGRREEARILLQAWTDFCAQKGSPRDMKGSLLALGRQALKARVTLPLARALAEWQRRHNGLTTEEKLLVANLFYTAGKNRDALTFYSVVEPQMGRGKRQRWVLVAMISAYLRSDQVEQAEHVLSRLKKAYPDAAEIDEAKYRFGVHYHDRRQLGKAMACFIALRKTSKSTGYKRLCFQYIERIKHLQSMKGARGQR